MLIGWSTLKGQHRQPLRHWQEVVYCATGQRYSFPSSKSLSVTPSVSLSPCLSVCLPLCLSVTPSISLFSCIPLSSALPRQHVEWLFMCLIDVHKASTVFLQWSFCERKHRTDNYKTIRKNLLKMFWVDLYLSAISCVDALSPQFVYLLSMMPLNNNHHMWLLWGLDLIRLWHNHVGSWWCNSDFLLSWYPFKIWKLFKFYALICSFCCFLLIL